MSAFSGGKFRGAMAMRREAKRLEAQERDRRSAHARAGRKLAEHELDPRRYWLASGWRRADA